MSKHGDTAIWHVPLLVLAGISAIAGIAVAIAVWQGALPEPWGPGVQWGLAGASATFTLARIIHARSVGRRELELVVIAAGVFLSQYMLTIAGAVIVVAIIALVLDEL